MMDTLISVAGRQTEETLVNLKQVASSVGRRHNDRFPPIWVLSLKRSTERREHIRGQLDALALDYEVIDAIDGRLLTEAEIAKSYSPESCLSLMGRELCPAEVGCALSHRGAWQRLLDEGLDEVLILEDDALLPPALLDVLRDRESLPEDWDLVLLYRAISQASGWGARPIGTDRLCVRLAECAFSALGYMLRPAGARKLIAASTPVQAGSDFLTGGWLPLGIRLYAIDPPCVGERFPLDASQSTMPESYVGRQLWPKREEIGPLNWAVFQTRLRLTNFYKKWNPLLRV